MHVPLTAIEHYLECARLATVKCSCKFKILNSVGLPPKQKCLVA